jgi:ABC-2 type transport system ATP-binding protein
MIEARNLVFDYPGTRALAEVSFTLRLGSITALVGPNGAGKTTLLRCLAALEEPSGGSILIDGQDIFADPRATHREIGYLSDFFGLYEDLTAEQCLQYAAMAHGIAAGRQAEQIGWCTGQLAIDFRLDVKAGTLSRGQRQRLAIAQAIIHRPRLLLLDEPASGLDPEARHSLALLFKRLQQEGMTLLVSSHILSELEEYSTDMLVLRGGRIIEQTSLASREQKTVMELRLAAATNLHGLLQQCAGLTLIEADDDRALFSCSADPAEQHRLLQELLAAGLRVCSFAEQKQNMQDAYLRTVKGVQTTGVAP